MTFSALVSALALALLAAAQPAGAVTREEATVQNAMVVLRELQSMPDMQIPDLLLSRAEGIVILPANVKAAFGLGARGGSGVLLVRNADRSWSHPVFVGTGALSFGFQAGAQVADIVLVLTTKRSIEGITDGKLTLGADASVAAGPVGRTAMAGTSLTFDSEVYAYSRSKGLFAGVSFEGNAIVINRKGNRRFYDGEGSPTAILARRGAARAPANELIAEVSRLTSVAGERVAAHDAETAAKKSERPVEPRTYPVPDEGSRPEPR
ncbi:MAG: lipid-binding SYLF domain-containing protein [Steroidobacteraceae bacterium]|nr:lipid-binding SYLF domain-containing protein [Steroidobacteraceae bacterium]